MPVDQPGGHRGRGLLLAAAGLGALSLALVVGLTAAALLLVVGGATGGSAACVVDSSAPSGQALADIPAVALDAYRRAGAASGVDWVYLAGIGKVESDHGRFAGRVVRPDGEVSPPIIGVPLDGRGGVQAVPDTDRGRWDGDPVWDRAVGPMQFLPGTWATAGADGNLDGVADPNNIYDAALAAAYYLKRAGAPANMTQAIFAYNRADWYVAQVLAAAAGYRAAAAAPPPTGSPAPTPPGSAGGLAGPWVLPLPAGSYTVTSRFGLRPNPTGGGGDFHTGLDMAAPLGAPIAAAAAGTVLAAGPSGGGYGTWVMLDNGGGVVTVYGHQSQVAVQVGEQVAAGQTIGQVGSTGRSTGPHLHFEVRVDGRAVDPEPLLAGAGVPAPGGGGCGAGDLTGSVGPGPWGGYQNGQIPVGDLCAPRFAPGVRLRCDAAAALDQLDQAYRARFGVDLTVGAGYQDLPAQLACREGRARCDAAVVAHGWAMAVDLVPGGAEQRSWLAATGPDWGWTPSLDGAHWEFGVRRVWPQNTPPAPGGIQ